MKRLTAIVLLCLVLAGCGGGERLRDPVTFYYLRTDYQRDMSSPIGSEQREASGHRQEVGYLLALYLMGPSQEELCSPLPEGTQVQSIELTEGGILLTLSDTSETMTETEYSLACACLTLTVSELTGKEAVTVVSGSRSVTMTREAISYTDTVGIATETEETQ